MKKVYALVIISLLLCSTIYAKQVGLATAQKAAQNFLKANGHFQPIELAYQEVSKASTPAADQIQRVYFYAFDIGVNNGFILISGDDKVQPVLGYCDEGTFSRDGAPKNFIKWLENYKSEIRYAIEAMDESEATQQVWTSLLEGRSTTLNKKKGGVSPLVTTKWNQSPYYNDLCPYDNNKKQRTVSGCVATAMAQIMKFWSYPKTGTGFHSYNHSKFGTLSANFGSTTYKWSSMPDKLTSSDSAVAILMYHCGVSVDMNYGVAADGGSTAYVISDQSPVTNCAEYAFKTYFGYKDATGKIRANYSLSSWINLLQNELDNGQPILYAGFGNGGGHAFVFDGYDDNDYFHVNWGWGGIYNGYFAVSALNPDDVGTGGGSGGYNSGQTAIVGIKPPSNNVSYNLILNDSISPSFSYIYYGQGFTLHTDIANAGNNDFEGDFCAAAFDVYGNFVEFIDSIKNVTLKAGYHYTKGVDFQTSGSFTLLPGAYYIYCFYRPKGGNWVKLENTSLWYYDFAFLRVINPNNIELYAEIKTDPSDNIYVNKKLTVTLDVGNYGSSTFSGTFDVSLYQLDGKFAFTIEEKKNMVLSSKTHYTNGLTFVNNNLDVKPGTYLLALTHKEDGGNWEITGSTNYTNPIKIIVKAAPLQPDQYENNNSVSSAFVFNPSFSNDQAKVLTTGSNNHVGTDNDYYKINLPGGYDYEITARVHDESNSGNSNTYTNDVIFSYSLDGQNWSDTYDDVMPNKIAVKNGGSLYIKEVPYFQGETGTYLFEASISRTQTIGIKETAQKSLFSIFPSPTTDVLNIRNYKQMQRGDIIDMQGKVHKILNKPTQQVDVADLAGGIYFLRIYGEQSSCILKFVKE